MASLKDAFNLNKLADFIIPKKEQYANSKTIFYVRIYTHILRADESMVSGRHARAINLLRIVRNMTKSEDFTEEKALLGHIREVVEEVLDWVKRQKRSKKQTDVYTATTKLQLVQNICILRMLKSSEK